MNPVAHAEGLKLSISETDKALEVELVLAVALVSGFLSSKPTLLSRTRYRSFHSGMCWLIR